MKKTKETREHIGYAITVDGVILNNIYEGDKIVSKEQDEYSQQYITNFKKKEAFVKMYVNPMIELYKDLTSKESAIVLGIMPFISYKDGILRCDGKITDAKTISEVLEENYDTCRKTIASLIKKQVLTKVEVQSDTYQNKTKQAIAVNPYIFLRGQDIERKIVDKFSDSKWSQF